MVEFADLGEANAMAGEIQSIEIALGWLDEGGRITSMVISPTAPETIGPGPGPFRTAVSVSTGYITYPPAMVEAIKAALQQRVVELHDRLAGFGVTGAVR